SRFRCKTKGRSCPGAPRVSRRVDQDRFWSTFSRASPSIVWSLPAIFCWLASADAPASASFMPSLKPLTAPPRSEPTLRSFLVPNTKRTMTSTISQCQMLKEPIPLSLTLQHGRQGIGPAQNMKVQMIHLLQSDSSGVHDGAKAVGAALLACNPARRNHQTPHCRLVFLTEVSHRVDVRLGDHQHMHRRNRVDVVEGEDMLVLIHLLRRNLATCDAAEDAVAHAPAFCAARDFFSSMPDTPSRRRNSASTSSTDRP